MRFERMTAIGAAGLCVAAAFGSGVAFAEEVGAADAYQSQIPMKTDEANSALFALRSMDCRDLDHGSHPYLVLNRDAGGHNEHRIGRLVKYHAGDGASLRFPLELVIAGNGLPIAETEYFSSATIQVQIAGEGGHRSFEVFCADSPQAANQK